MLKYVVVLAIAMAMIVDAGMIRDEPQQEDDEDCIKKCKSRPLELSFVVDGSASIWQRNFTYALHFIEDFVETFDISQEAVRVSMVTYGDVVYTQDAFGFTRHDNKQDLMLAISRIPYRSGIKTNTSGGIWYMLRQQMPEARSDVRHVVIVLTDGNSQEADLTKEAAEDAARANLEVFAIGVGQSVSFQELHNIASSPDYVFEVANYNMLEHIKDRLKYKACGNTPAPPCKMDPMDMSFVIDSSVSIGEGNFSIGMKFVTDFVDNFQINPHTVRVSAVTFGDRLYLQDAFNFEDYETKKEVMDRLERIPWRHGVETKTGLGINYMRTVQKAQARKNVPHVCIVITDGESQEGAVTVFEAEEAQKQGVVMYAVGVGEIGKQLNEQELFAIAGQPSHVLSANSYAQLNLLKEELVKITCEGVSHAAERLAAPFRQ